MSGGQLLQSRPCCLGVHSPMALKMVVVSTMPMITKTPIMAYPAGKSGQRGISQQHMLWGAGQCSWLQTSPT